MSMSTTTGMTMLTYEFMQNAFVATAMVAIVAGLVGYFLVLRGQTFAGHALSHIGFAGATGAGPGRSRTDLGPRRLCARCRHRHGSLIGERLARRDVAIGVVLAFALGLGLLFLHYYTSFATQATAILFGSVLAVSRPMLSTLALLGAVTLIALAVVMRPLIFATLQPELAEAKGVPMRLVSTIFLAIVAIAVAESAQIVGVLLVFALMVGPPAAAQLIARRLGTGLVLAAIFAVAVAWLGIVVAYYTDWPASFCIATLSAALFFGCALFSAAQRPDGAS